MKSLWQPLKSGQNAVDECVQGSRTIGAHKSLVLHGGGNSSIKATVVDVTGDDIETLYVKGSGWDMASIEPQGFAPLRMDRLRQLLTVKSITDTALVNELRSALVDASAPDPSIESLLHALLPYRAVLHSHADVIVSLTNQPDPAAVVSALFGHKLVLVPYVKPGFDLARRCNELWPQLATPETRGMVLLNHGLFTFGDTMEEAYSRHVEIISAAEDHLRFISETEGPAPSVPLSIEALTETDASTARHDMDSVDLLAVARLRGAISRHAGQSMIMCQHIGPRVRNFLGRKDLTRIVSRGPATPDHIIHTKRIPLVGRDIDGYDVEAYVQDYQAYFERNRDRSPVPLTMLDPTPRFMLDSKRGMFTVGRTVKEANIVRDIAMHTFDVIEAAEKIGRYTSLTEDKLFDIEYWELEQAKLRRGGVSPELAGQVAFVTGAASGIGRSIANKLLDLGACVVGVDISEDVTTTFSCDSWLGIQADVQELFAIEGALRQTVQRFGGLDMLIVAAGVFPESVPITGLDGRAWDRTLAINVGSVQALFGLAQPLLAESPTYGRVVVIGSKNVAAPGPGAAAYSASKAALTQLARVAALEWAVDGIRVNTVHPDAVFDTGLWAPELLAERAARYGVSVEEYKRRNLLSTEVSSLHVAQMVGAMCTPAFQSTTGAQVPVDGGNDRVI
ncbi:bifunctional aldolase/short-chain dehydrogenase [Arthrobacter sp. zg-Y238]|uniref:bifunctional aldolase/short-chain dehydrogenase n=1 Tax=Arthrobacter sp. zg-Y238 TaxID=2964614 RepID=UPI0021066085|nr:bifunctional aldolase/short-chain dehydrogenase [Arthrobacter sp. zg-Y238]